MSDDSQQPRRSNRPPGRSRQALLEPGAAALGAQWTRSYCDRLREQGRRIAGGWPGTLSEARARVHTYWGAELRPLGMSELTSEEREKVARLAYAHARRAWLSCAARDDTPKLPSED